MMTTLTCPYLYILSNIKGMQHFTSFYRMMSIFKSCCGVPTSILREHLPPAPCLCLEIVDVINLAMDYDPQSTIFVMILKISFTYCLYIVLALVANLV
jgi:hypothetical protein